MRIFKNIIIGIILAGVFFVSGLFIGCKTFDPITIDGQPNECNDMYTTMRLYVKTGIKSDSLITTMATNCTNARKYKSEKNCLRWINDGKEIDKKDYKKQLYLKECKK